MCFVALMCVSCNSDGCLENRASLPKTGFYSASTDAQITLDSLEITGIGIKTDAPLIKPGLGYSELYLPMRATSDETAWQIRYMWYRMGKGAIADTITFKYSSEPYFASEECGVVYNYHIDKMEYTRHVIEYVEITDSMVTNVDKERIKIFFRTE